MADKTEAPSPRRLQEARERGQVPFSVELNAALGLLVGIWLLQGPGNGLASSMANLITGSIHMLPNLNMTDAALKQYFYISGVTFLPSLLPVVLGLMAIGVTSTLLQKGITLASKRPFVDFSRVNPLNGFKRFFSSQGLMDLLKSLMKLVIIGWVAFSYIRGNLGHFAALFQMDLMSALADWADLAFGLIWRTGWAFLLIAAIDYIYQRRQFMNQMKMTKQEVKEEYKQSEGDPNIKGRIRGIQRQAARQRMMAQVPKADVIITNPTHLALAIAYDSAVMQAPTLLAKGADNVAFKIVEIAKEHNIPVMQDIPLARAMYKTVEIDQEIPPQLYAAMASVLAYVYKLKKQVVRN